MASPPIETLGPAVTAHFLGLVDYGSCLALQERLAAEADARGDGQIKLLFCEHPTVVTIGRGGLPGVPIDSTLLRSRQIEVCWVKRGGGAMLHTPGQLNVYPIFPLAWHGLTVGQYLDRLQAGLLAALAELGIPAHGQPGRYGVWGRTGQLAEVGVAVRNWVAYHGFSLNVVPPMGLFHLVRPGSDPDRRLSCLVAERGQPVKMTTVRAELVCRLAAAFGCDRYHLHTGHPALKRVGSGQRVVGSDE